MKYLFKNNAAGALAAELSSLATSFTLGVGEGANFPNPTVGESFWVTLQVGSDIEVMEVTARTGDTFTVIRAREGTLARVWPTASPVEMRLTQTIMGAFFQLGQSIVDFANTLALGVSGKITGGTLENNTLTNPTINNPNLKTASVKPVDGNVTKAIVLPNGGGAPTIAGSEIITTTGGQFSGPLETTGAVAGLTGTFGQLLFKSGTTPRGTVDMTDTVYRVTTEEDVDIIWITDAVERMRYDKTTRNFGIGVVSPLQAMHLKKGDVVVYYRAENADGYVDMGIDADGRTVILNNNTKGFRYAANGVDRLAIDDAGRMTVPGGNANGVRTVSVADPSGGADGDIWLKV